MASAANFEKLGVCYLGRPYDWQQKKAQDGLILYDSKDLVTPAVCVGMTGSGKTGLCLALIEEAAIDGIPAILIDKGDLANLLLTFPGLKPEDFRPWVNEDDARRMGTWPLARIKNFSWPPAASKRTVVGPGFDQADGTPGVRTKGTGDGAASRTPSHHHDVEELRLARMIHLGSPAGTTDTSCCPDPVRRNRALGRLCDTAR